jgi:hypothetical protein
MRHAFTLDPNAMKQQDAPVMSSTSNRGSIISLALAVASLALGVTFSVTLGGCSGESSPGDEGAGGSGASGGSGGKGATGLPNPCTLATSAELGPIVDITLVRSGEIRGLSGDPSCTWYDAEDNGVFQLSIWSDDVQYEFSKDDARSVPLSGIGVEAHLGTLSTVHVLTSKGAFHAQALKPAADGAISPEIQSALSTDMMPQALRYEAAFRFAKLVVNDL